MHPGSFKPCKKCLLSPRGTLVLFVCLFLIFSDSIVAVDCVGRDGNILLIEVMVKVRVLMMMRVLSSAGLWDGHLRFIYLY